MIRLGFNFSVCSIASAMLSFMRVTWRSFLRKISSKANASLEDSVTIKTCFLFTICGGSETRTRKPLRAPLFESGSLPFGTSLLDNNTAAPRGIESYRFCAAFGYFFKISQTAFRFPTKSKYFCFSAVPLHCIQRPHGESNPDFHLERVASWPLDDGALKRARPGTFNNMRYFNRESKLPPVISAGFSMPNISKIVGATSERTPSELLYCALISSALAGVSLFHLFPTK